MAASVSAVNLRAPNVDQNTLAQIENEISNLNHMYSNEYVDQFIQTNSNIDEDDAEAKAAPEKKEEAKEEKKEPEAPAAPI